MELELDTQDLEPQFRDISTSMVRFKMFKPKVRLAIVAVGGRALFRRRDTHNAILSPSGLTLKDYVNAGA